MLNNYHNAHFLDERLRSLRVGAEQCRRYQAGLGVIKGGDHLWRQVMKLQALGSVAIAATTFAMPALAQRYLNYDAMMSIPLTGTVVGLDWMNPNSELFVRAKDPATGKEEQWVFLMAPPTRSLQFGWKPNSLKPGDTVNLVMHPAKDGSMRGQLVSLTLPDGRTLQKNGPASRNKSQNRVKS